MLTIQPGKYYFTVVCKICGEQFAFAEAPDMKDVTGGVDVTSPGVLVHSTCGRSALYQSDEVEIHQEARMN